MRRIFLDTETTGLEPKLGHRIVEVAAVAYDGRTPIAREDGGEFHHYLNPQREIDAGALETHGLDLDFLAAKPLFADIADDFIEFVRGAGIYIHNAEFDCDFLNAELSRLEQPPLEDIADHIVCTLNWSRENNKSLHGHSLKALCSHFEIDDSMRKQWHSAIVDSQLLARVYFRMTQQQTALDIRPPAMKKTLPTAPVRVRRATEAELAAHAQMLAGMEKETRQKPLFLQLNDG